MYMRKQFLQMGGGILFWILVVVNHRTSTFPGPTHRIKKTKFSVEKKQFFPGFNVAWHHGYAQTARRIHFQARLSPSLSFFISKNKSRYIYGWCMRLPIWLYTRGDSSQILGITLRKRIWCDLVRFRKTFIPYVTTYTYQCFQAYLT